MKVLDIATLCLALTAPIGSATSDPWKDESSKGRERSGYYDRGYRDRDDDFRHRDRREGRERKVEYDDGRCRVELKWEMNGDYKEERKCRGGPPGSYGRPDYSGYGSFIPPAAAPGPRGAPPPWPSRTAPHAHAPSTPTTEQPAVSTSRPEAETSSSAARAETAVPAPPTVASPPVPPSTTAQSGAYVTGPLSPMFRERSEKRTAQPTDPQKPAR